MFHSISGCISEYGMKVIKKISNVSCINVVKKEIMWNFYGRRICEVAPYKYLSVRVKAGLNSVFKSMWDIMVDANGVLGMVKYAATRFGSKIIYVVWQRRIEEYDGNHAIV